MTNRFHATVFACLICIPGEMPLSAASPTNVINTSTFTHLTYGRSGNGFWDTEISVVSTSTGDGAFELDILDNDGKPKVVDSSLGTGSTFVFTLPPSATKEIVINGQNSSTTEEGFGQLKTLQGAANAGLTFTFHNLTNGAPLFSVPVEFAEPATTFVSQANALTGVAAVNLDPDNAVGLETNFYDSNGKLTGSATSTVGPFSHSSFNLSTIFTNLGPTVQGSVKVSASAPLLIMGIGAQPSGSSFEAFAIPNVSYDPLASSFSGTFSVINGPDVGATGTLTINNIAPISTNTFSATVSTVFQGKTNSDTFNFQSLFWSPGYDSVDLSDCSTDTLAPFGNGFSLSARGKNGGSLSGVIYECKPGGNIATWNGVSGK